MPKIGPMELIVVLVIALVVLGPKRLPDAGKSLGRGMRVFTGASPGGGARDETEHELTCAAARAADATPPEPQREPVA